MNSESEAHILLHPQDRVSVRLQRYCSQCFAISQNERTSVKSEKEYIFLVFQISIAQDVDVAMQQTGKSNQAGQVLVTGQLSIY